MFQQHLWTILTARSCKNPSSVDLFNRLVVYDKHSRCLLTEGEYELVLSELAPESSENQNNSNSKKTPSWEHISTENSDKVLLSLVFVIVNINFI